MNRRSLFWLPATLVMVCSCASPTNPRGSGEIVRAEPIKDAKPIAKTSQAFAVSLLQQMLSSNKDSDFMLSPWSLTNCIEMLRYGATGKTEAELRKFLGSDVDAEGASRQIERVKGALKPIADNDIFRTANGIWVAKNYPIELNYLAKAPSLFGATLKNSEMPEPALSEINTMVKETTRDRIPTLLDSLSPDTFMVLVNAVSFKDNWLTKFDPSQTAARNFSPSTGVPVSVPMMNMTGKFAYREKPSHQILTLNYESGIAMTIILPKGRDLATVLQDKDLMGTGYTGARDGTVSIPKWKSEYTLDLESFMKTAGCRLIFDSTRAELGGIAKGAFVSKAVHKTFIEVNERGTEAAAATGIGAAAAAPEPQPPFTFIADHPFAYYIHTYEGVILFAGVVNNPKS